VRRDLHVHDGLAARHALQLAADLLQEDQRDVVAQLVVAVVADLDFAFDLAVVVAPRLDVLDLRARLAMARCRLAAGHEETASKHQNTGHSQQCS
jgi:hypothetical protein